MFGTLQGEAGDLVLLSEGAMGKQTGMFPLTLSGFQEDASQLPNAG